MSMIDVYTTSWIANANVGQRPGIHFSALSYAFGVGDNAGGTGDGYSTRALTIASTTEVGIGTTTPWGKLSVTQTGTAGAPAFIVEDSASPDTTPFIIDQTGNVGIGTTSPSTKLEINNSMAFTSEHNQTSSSNAVTVDWTTGNYQQINTLTEDTTITFVAPNNKKAVGQLQIRFVMDGVGGYNVTWPASVKWPGGTAPTLTMFAGTSDIIGFWYDGTNYYNNYTMLDVR